MPSNVFSQEKGGVRVPADQIARRWTTILLLFAVLFPAIVSFGILHRQAVLTGVELYRAAPGRNSPMIDPQVERLFPSEKVFEQVTLTKAIQEGIYTLPPKQEIRPILEAGGVWQK
jgi:hypothetical protein